MLEWRWGGVRYRISLLFPALITALLLCQLNGLTVSCLLASIIHEGGHLLAMLAMGIPPRGRVRSALAAAARAASLSQEM